MERCGALPHAPAGEGALARPREQRTENRKQSARQARDKTIVVQRNQTSKHPSFQTSNCPCTGGTSGGRARQATGTSGAAQEIQERPCGAMERRCTKRREPPSYMSYTSYMSYRGVQDCQCGEPQIAEEHRGLRRVTEEHRDGRRASARWTASVFWESQRTRRTKGR